MDHLKKIEFVIQKLSKSGYTVEAKKIEILENAASVGSELLMSVTHELLLFINSDKKLKDLIGNDTNELKDFCWSIGLQVT